MPDFDKHVCSSCIGDPIVKGEIRQDGEAHICSYCDKKRKCITLKALADRVDDVYRQNVRPSREDYYSSGEPPEELIREMLRSEPEIAEDLTAFLSDAEGYGVIRDGDTPYYEPSSTYELQPAYDVLSSSWNEIVESIKHKSRFFGADAIAVLHELFRGIDRFEYQGKQPPIRSIGPKSDERFVYRARRANSEQERIAMCLAPAQLLGPPPKEVAVSGRMNAMGISTFYGAFDAETCVSELRLGIGEVAVSCKFEIVRAIRVLDLTVLNQLRNRTSIFDAAHDEIATRLAFLHHFEEAISRPVRPGGEFEYLPTQALAEYLALHYQPRIDAVIYSSTQNRGGANNIVILSHAAVISGSKKNAPIDARYEEFWDDDGYAIWDKRGVKRRERRTQFDFFTDLHIAAKPKPYLRPMKEGLTIHRVTAVKHSMQSARWEGSALKEKELPF